VDLGLINILYTQVLKDGKTPKEELKSPIATNHIVHSVDLCNGLHRFTAYELGFSENPSKVYDGLESEWDKKKVY
jgi:hypothetical protein